MAFPVVGEHNSSVILVTFFSCASFDHLLYFPEEGLHLLQIDQTLSKRSYILYALHTRNWNIDRRDVVCAEKKKVLVTYKNSNQPYI